MRLEGLGKLKKSTSSGLDPATFRLAAYCLNQLRYCVPPCKLVFEIVFSLYTDFQKNQEANELNPCSQEEEASHHMERFDGDAAPSHETSVPDMDQVS
jgi:hypothetical protein